MEEQRRNNTASECAVYYAVPAFDSSEQEYAYYQQELAKQAVEEAHTNNTASETAVYHAVPAFDSPEQELAYYERLAEREAFEERYSQPSYN